MEYELIRKSGVINTEGTSDENQGIDTNNNDNNNNIKINDNNINNINNIEDKNISIEDKLKMGLEAKNESIKKNF